MIERGTHFHHIHAADHLIHSAEAELCHPLADLFCDKEKEIDDVLWSALKFFPEFRILRGDANRAGIEMALAHHDTAHCHERSSREAELFGTEQSSNDDIAASLQFSVHLYANTAAKIVHHKHLLRFGKPKFPRNSGVL